MSASISAFVLCGGCSRHFRAREAECPFCGADAALASARSQPVQLAAGSSRARLRAAVLASSAMVACSGDFTSTSQVKDQDGGSGSGQGGSATGGRSTGGRTSTGGRSSNGGSSAGGTSAGGSGAGGAGGVAAGGAMNTGGIGGGRTCNGATNPSGTLCRTSQDCTNSGTGGFIGGFWNCYMTVPSNNCGRFPPQECSTNANCADAGICQTDMCGGRTCIAACDPVTCTGTNACQNGICAPKRCDMAGAAPCGAEFECNPNDPTASPLGCVPIHCASNADCAPGYDCSASATGKGCVHRQCTVDTDCACGYCVNTYCEATLGFCYQIIATPYGCVWPDEELV